MGGLLDHCQGVCNQASNSTEDGAAEAPATPGGDGQQRPHRQRSGSGRAKNRARNGNSSGGGNSAVQPDAAAQPPSGRVDEGGFSEADTEMARRLSMQTHAMYTNAGTGAGRDAHAAENFTAATGASPLSPPSVVEERLLGESIPQSEQQQHDSDADEDIQTAKRLSIESEERRQEDARLQEEQAAKQLQETETIANSSTSQQETKEEQQREKETIADLEASPQQASEEEQKRKWQDDHKAKNEARLRRLEKLSSSPSVAPSVDQRERVDFSVKLSLQVDNLNYDDRLAKGLRSKFQAKVKEAIHKSDLRLGNSRIATDQIEMDIEQCTPVRLQITIKTQGEAWATKLQENLDQKPSLVSKLQDRIKRVADQHVNNVVEQAVEPGPANSTEHTVCSPSAASSYASLPQGVSQVIKGVSHDQAVEPSPANSTELVTGSPSSTKSCSIPHGDSCVITGFLQGRAVEPDPEKPVEPATCSPSTTSSFSIPHGVSIPQVLYGGSHVIKSYGKEDEEAQSKIQRDVSEETLTVPYHGQARAQADPGASPSASSSCPLPYGVSRIIDDGSRESDDKPDQSARGRIAPLESPMARDQHDGECDDARDRDPHDITQACSTSPPLNTQETIALTSSSETVTQGRWDPEGNGTSWGSPAPIPALGRGQPTTNSSETMPPASSSESVLKPCDNRFALGRGPGAGFISTIMSSGHQEDKDSDGQPPANSVDTIGKPLTNSSESRNSLQISESMPSMPPLSSTETAPHRFNGGLGQPPTISSDSRGQPPTISSDSRGKLSTNSSESLVSFQISDSMPPTISSESVPHRSDSLSASYDRGQATTASSAVVSRGNMQIIKERDETLENARGRIAPLESLPAISRVEVTMNRFDSVPLSSQEQETAGSSVVTPCGGIQCTQARDAHGLPHAPSQSYITQLDSPAARCGQGPSSLSRSASQSRLPSQQDVPEASSKPSPPSGPMQIGMPLVRNIRRATSGDFVADSDANLTSGDSARPTAQLPQASIDKSTPSHSSSLAPFTTQMLAALANKQERIGASKPTTEPIAADTPSTVSGQNPPQIGRSTSGTGSSAQGISGMRSTDHPFSTSSLQSDATTQMSSASPHRVEVTQVRMATTSPTCVSQSSLAGGLGNPSASGGDRVSALARAQESQLLSACADPAVSSSNISTVTPVQYPGLQNREIDNPQRREVPGTGMDALSQNINRLAPALDPPRYAAPLRGQRLVSGQAVEIAPHWNTDPSHLTVHRAEVTQARVATTSPVRVYQNSRASSIGNPSASGGDRVSVSTRTQESQFLSPYRGAVASPATYSATTPVQHAGLQNRQFESPRPRQQFKDVTPQRRAVPGTGMNAII